MAETFKPSPENDPDDHLIVEKTGGLSLIWLIPLVALSIGLWLAWKTLSEAGPVITITFKDGGGLEAGKTKVKYKEVEIGTVKTVILSDDLSHVIVTAELEKNVEDHLGDDTKFWVVEPQLGLSGVSGLDTLIAGHYIAVEFGNGKHTRKFQGLERAPKISADTPGKHFTLSAESLGSLTEGTPIYFRDIKVGRVVEAGLAADKASVSLDVFIDAPYDGLIHNSSRFWQTSGIDMSMNSQGFNLKVGSLLSLLGGGISFDTPTLRHEGEQASQEGTKFTLYKDHASVLEGLHPNKSVFLLYFDDSVRGLSVGASVELKGIRIGTVTDIWIKFDPESNKLQIPVYIEIDPDRLMTADVIAKYVELNKSELEKGRRPVIEKMVSQGLRARLKSGSLITGQLYVDLDFYPDETAAKLVYHEHDYPQIPTLPSVVEEFQKDAKEILAKLKKLPLDKIGMEILGITQGTNRLVNSPDLHESLRTLNAAMKDVHKLTQTADREISKLVASADKSLAAATKVIEQLEPGAPMSVDVGNALEELSASARSIRALTDYLERHPESLLHGKSGAKK